jgi:spore coat protein CotH
LLHGKNSIFLVNKLFLWGIFNSYVTNYQRVTGQVTPWPGDKDAQLSASQLRARHGVQNGTAGGGGDGGMRLGGIEEWGIHGKM